MTDLAPRDEGGAAERTQLAWGRSALSLVGCGVAVSRGIPTVTGSDARPWLGAALMMLGSLVWLGGVSLAATRARAGRYGARPTVTYRELAPVAYGTAVVGLAGLVIAALFTG